MIISLLVFCKLLGALFVLTPSENCFQMHWGTGNVFGLVQKQPFESLLTFRNVKLTINEFDICSPHLFFSFDYFHHFQPAALPLNLKPPIPS